ncbi:MAG: TrkA family potassium uptake protein [Caldilinea sp. CFX5]|nr:TrkA family potassium uptake protein [Caldilinea sp. CFX5]
MNMIIIGCGRMGAGLAHLLSLRGHALTVVDKEQSAFAALGPTFRGRTLVGVGFDREVLLAAGVARADGVAAVTNSDEANIVAARIARTMFRVPSVVARVVDPQKAEIYQRLGVQTISTTVWGINRIANLLSYNHLDVVCDLSSSVELVQMELPARLAGRTVQNLTIPGEVHVVAIKRSGQTFLPTSSASLQAGDLLYLAVQAASADRLTALLRGG